MYFWWIYTKLEEHKASESQLEHSKVISIRFKMSHVSKISPWSNLKHQVLELNYGETHHWKKFGDWTIRIEFKLQGNLPWNERS